MTREDTEPTFAELFTGHPVAVSVHGGEVCKRCDENAAETVVLESGDDVLATAAWGDSLGEWGWSLVGVFHEEHTEIREPDTDPKVPVAVLEATVERTGGKTRSGFDPEALTLGGVDLVGTQFPPELQTLLG